MKIIEHISKIVLYVAMFMMVGMMLLTVADVFMRYVFNDPIQGTVEITQNVMVILPLGMAVCALELKHIKLDIVVTRLPEQARAILEIITLLGGIWIMVFLTWAGIETGISSIKYKTMYLKLPELPFRGVLALSYATLFLATMLVIARKIMELVKR